MGKEVRKVRRKDGKCFENYPCWIVVFSNFISLATYFIGAFIILQLGVFYLVIYLVYILILEFRVMKNSCVNCYYYDKFCAFGKGKLSALFFKRGKKENIEKFAKRGMCWKDLLPDFLVSLLPIIIGIVLVIFDFSWLLLCLIIILVILAFPGSGFVRGSLACKFCKQRKIGCPAEKLFEKTKK
jgi:hypothetical protein